MTVKTPIPPFVIIAISMFMLIAITPKPNKMIGKWQDDKDGKLIMEIYLAKDDFYYGKVVSTPDNKGEVGYLMFRKCQYDPKTETLKGTMHPPDSNLIIDATIQLEKDGKLKVVGKKFLITQTLYFIKAN